MICAMISDLDGILVQTGQRCVAVTTPFTQCRIHAERVLHARRIVDDPGTLSAVVRQMVAEQKWGTLRSLEGTTESPPAAFG